MNHYGNIDARNWRNEIQACRVSRARSNLVEAFRHPILMRYQQASLRLLESARDPNPIPVKEFVIRKLMCEEVLGGDYPEWHKVAKFLGKRLPAVWTKRHIKAIGADKNVQDVFIRTRGFIVLLLLSIFCESADEIMNILFKNTVAKDCVTNAN
ncbi:MAG: hypothetical protein WCP99_21575 [Burkholderiales bacterium]